MMPRPPIQDALFVVGAPRSGTSILQRVLAMHEELWGLFGESHRILEGPLRPDLDRGESNRVGADRFTEELGNSLQARFHRWSINLPLGYPDDHILRTTGGMGKRLWARALSAAVWARQGRYRPSSIHLLEKTPKNSLRIPFLARLVPTGRFVLLTRDHAATVDSLISGWHAFERVGPFPRKPFGTYRTAHRLHLTDLEGPYWSFVLIPGWTEFNGRSVADVAAAQYVACVTTAAADLAELAPERRLVVRYEELLSHPAETVERVLAAAGLRMTDRVARFARTYVSPQRPGKMLRNAVAVEQRRPLLEEADATVARHLPEAR